MRAHPQLHSSNLLVSADGARVRHIGGSHGPGGTWGAVDLISAAITIKTRTDAILKDMPRKGRMAALPWGWDGDTPRCRRRKGQVALDGAAGLRFTARKGVRHAQTDTDRPD